MARSGFQRANTIEPGDDLRLIRGIGPAIAGRLQAAGIRTFLQLGRLTPARVAQLVPRRSAKRISKENWIGQARKLANQAARTKTATQASDKHGKSAVHGLVRQHYETFTVELLLDKKNIVRRTRCAHIQSGDRDAWAGWHEPRLMSFVVKHAGLGVPGVPAPGPPTHSEAALPATMMAQPILPLLPEAGLAPVQALEVETGGEEPGAKQETQPHRAETLCHFEAQSDMELRARPDMGGLGGVLRLLKLVAMPMDSDEPCEMLPAGRPLRLRLSLDMADVTGPPNEPLDCIASIYAKRRGGGPRQIIGEAHATMKLDDKVTVEVPGQVSPPGLYRLDALVLLNQSPLDPQGPRGLIAMLKGSLLQIY